MSWPDETVSLRLLGQWLPGQIHCHWGVSSFAPAPAVIEIINQAWRQRVAAQGGVVLFDGPMCRLESYGVDSATGHLMLALSRTSYKAFLGTNMTHPELADQYGPEALANPVGLSCALVSTEGNLLLGRRNEKVAYYPGRIHPFAGALEERQPMDLFAEVRRELEEELGLTEADIAEMACIGLIEDRSLRQPELVFRVCAKLGAAEMMARLDAREHTGALCVRPQQSAVEAILKDPALTPVAVGTVRLWSNLQIQ